jgi:hypothetical protein
LRASAAEHQGGDNARTNSKTQEGKRGKGEKGKESIAGKRRTKNGKLAKWESEEGMLRF